MKDDCRQSPWELAVAPPHESWDEWVELDSRAWPTRRERHFRLVPTICFNCESACGLLAYVDKESSEIDRFEGNPLHPGSRGRTCAKGPATINQVRDPERILEPQVRSGPRGSGQYRTTTWEEVIADLGQKIRKALVEGRHDELMYHVGRPGEDHFVQRMLTAWGVDGHNSHTNVCSAAARLGYALWFGADRPSPDYTGVKFILLFSAHLETGHYFNPHAQRIIDARSAGARMAVVDTRLSNTTAHADHWISPWPGSESALLLGIARELLARDAIDHEFVKRWTNWQEYLAAEASSETSYESFIASLKRRYDSFTPAMVAEECQVPVETVTILAEEIVRAGRQFASHLWRNTASGNLGGWQAARCLMLLHVLTGSIGNPGGVNPNTWDKFAPKPSRNPPPIARWNELIWPRQWPLAHYEMSFLLPHLLTEQQRRIDVYFTRVYNPVWTNPDGGSWIDMLSDEKKIGCHVALTPTWNESAQWADYVLPVGLGPERHDLMSQETHAGTWIGFRQPVLLEHRRAEGESLDSTLGVNPGRVWQEAEFWVALAFAIDPDGALGIRQWFESPESKGTPVTMDEYFGDIFSSSVPGLPEAAAQAGLDPLSFMKKRGAFAVPYQGQNRFEKVAAIGEGIEVAPGDRRAGFKTPSGKLEVYSKTLADWGHAAHATPGYIRSHVHWRNLDLRAGERVLLPTFRLPTLIHTRSGNSKWLQEISHTNPLWIHPRDAEALQIPPESLVRVSTKIGHFVLRAWITEGIHPGVVACSHHVGRWRLHPDGGGGKLASSLIDYRREGEILTMRQLQGPSAHESADADTSRIWWHEAGVNQNLTFPVQPDPISGMHCWHQLVSVAPADTEDRYGDIRVDLALARAVYSEWLADVRPAPGPGGLRRPLWLNRPLHPTPQAYRFEEAR